VGNCPGSLSTPRRGSLGAALVPTCLTPVRTEADRLQTREYFAAPLLECALIVNC
jgi:hypothetical protein